MLTKEEIELISELISMQLELHFYESHQLSRYGDLEYFRNQVEYIKSQLLDNSHALP